MTMKISDMPARFFRHLTLAEKLQTMLNWRN